ncbi:sulfotransferase [Alteromonas sp. a30]|uniref:sulfotransferase n=1 Tax=Alteromonas sp. a30 TaxID=2730917 RepID=UPI002282F907|nr:sulfotransferase [Alteromonas sp. a30]MCY7296704.1 hypothetical protein [Alteromonas sp. a30]
MSKTDTATTNSNNTLYPGAMYDLHKKVKTNLFLICPNNSGSTFLKGIMAHSRNTWNLKREGQHMAGFQGNSTSGIGAELLWATDKWLSYFTDETAYNWPKTQKAWYFTATALHPDASVFFTKSPPAIVWVEQLKQHFFNSQFIFMVRNPYAVVEGIARRKRDKFPRQEILGMAADHIMKCFELQIKNIEKHQDALFFTYEEMCSAPDKIAEQLASFVPELNDLNMDVAIPVKGNYCESLRNMNDQQISNLSQHDLSEINRVFDRYPEYLGYFGYQRISSFNQ